MLGQNTLDRRFLIRKRKELKLLITSDLHLGLEVVWFNKKTESYDPKWSYETVDNLKRDIDAVKPNTLVILGDLEHNISDYWGKKEGGKILNNSIKKKALEYFQQKIFSIQELEIVLVRGEQETHDINKLETRVNIFPESGVSFADNTLGVFHGNMDPIETILFSSEIILGHLHPAIELTDEFKVSHELPVFSRLVVSREEVFKIFGYDLQLEDTSLIEEVPITILPAYNHFIKGFILNRKWKNDVKRSIINKKWMKKLLRHPELEIRLTNGIDIGHLTDL